MARAMMISGREGILGRGRGLALLTAYVIFLWATVAVA
jgi:hypothetical protein